MKKKFIYIHSLKNEVIAFDEIMEENRSLTAHCKMIFIVALKYKVYIAINIPAEIFIYNFFYDTVICTSKLAAHCWLMYSLEIMVICHCTQMWQYFKDQNYVLKVMNEA